jgi:tRNA-modifying protein YgfZ
MHRLGSPGSPFVRRSARDSGKFDWTTPPDCPGWQQRFIGFQAAPQAKIRSCDRIVTGLGIHTHEGFDCMKAALLPDRGVVKVGGDGARNFLHGLVTADILKLGPGAARFCALLTPQGKIIADFIAVEAPAAAGGGFLLDTPRELVATLVEKLNLYKLRAKATIEDLSETLGVVAAWNGGAAAASGQVYADPRLAALGLRMLVPPQLAAAAAAELGATLVTAKDYDAHRIALGVPQGGVDFKYGDAFPHETDMDQLGGVDFAKGCYVGQEVVSRMEHRGTARTRAVPLRYDSAAPPQPGTAIAAGERPVGTMGSAANGSGIAFIRLDRAAEAMAQGVPLAAGGVPVRLAKPDWARFAFPGDAVSERETKAAG